MSTQYYKNYDEWLKDVKDQGLTLVKDEFRSECFEGEPLRMNLRGYFSGDRREQFGWINESRERSCVMVKETAKKAEAREVREPDPKDTRRCKECGTLNHVSRISCTNCKARLYTGDNGLKSKSMSELVVMYNELSGGNPVKKFQDKATAIKRVEELLKAKGKATKKAKRSAAAKEKGGPKKPSKFGIIREMFAEKKSWTLDEIVKRSGFDQQNVMTAMSILKNPTRTGADKLVTTDYDRATKTFTLMK